MADRQDPDVKLSFTVDAALLSELGERLVGRPYIALAELVKNSYDADAHAVVINLTDALISVHDNGDGMSEGQFRDFWMRVGTPNKQRKGTSDLGRPLTGSKGIGRLAVQFLAARVRIVTVSKQDSSRQLVAEIQWDQAQRVDDLEQVTASVWREERDQSFPGGKDHGTLIELEKLRQTWSDDDATDLAKEIWTLQPPYLAPKDLADDDPQRFSVTFAGESAKRAAFEKQMHAVLDLWNARIKGQISADRKTGVGNVSFSVQYRGETEQATYSYPIDDCPVSYATFDIRINRLTGKQRHQVKVGEARDFFEKYGGVHVYDAAFRLPYYGVDHDWLGTERDHAGRRGVSQLLPDELQVKGGLTFLPANRRLYGVVELDTNKERSYALERQARRRQRWQDAQTRKRREWLEANPEKKPQDEPGFPFDEPEFPLDALTIQPSRDRLVENVAYEELKRAVRFSLDFYAMGEKTRKVRSDLSNHETVPMVRRLKSIEEVLSEFVDEVPESVLERLTTELAAATRDAEAEQKKSQTHLALLGGLATAGMGVLAFEHEFGKELELLADLARRLSAGELADAEQQTLGANVSEWIGRAKDLRAVFIPLLEDESRQEVVRFRALPILRKIRDGLLPLTRSASIKISPEVDDELLLPPATFASWNAILQNVILNAVNATLDQEVRLVTLSARVVGKQGEIRVEDTGSGVDRATSEELFKPFERRTVLSEERRQLGLGGTGLGLTIVRMIAEQIGCDVGFDDPSDGYATAFSLKWREK